MKFCIVGTGIMARIYADIIVQYKLGEITGFVGNTESKTNKIAADFSTKAFSNGELTKFYDSCDSNITLITTPEWVRIEPIKLAIENQQHIILEKPFADSLENSFRLYNLLENHKKTFRICHVLRYSPRFYSAKSYLLDKSVFYIDASRNSNILRFQRISSRVHPVFWLSSHDLDQMIWIKDRTIVEVYSKSNDGLKNLVTSIFQFDDGTTASLRNVWGHPPVSNLTRSTYFNVWHEDGLIEINDSHMNITIAEKDYIGQPDTYEDFSMHGKKHGYFKDMLIDFISNIKDENIISDLEISLETSRVMSMMEESITKEKIIKRT